LPKLLQRRHVGGMIGKPTLQRFRVVEADHEPECIDSGLRRAIAGLARLRPAANVAVANACRRWLLAVVAPSVTRVSELPKRQVTIGIAIKFRAFAVV